MTNPTKEERAIEFGEYMAKAADRVLTGVLIGSVDLEAARQLRSAIYEFRKRAKKTGAWLGEHSA